MDGLKVWDFLTVENLGNYLIGKNVTELLARSGLIRNEAMCSCGRPMRLRLHTTTTLYYYVWYCYGGCVDDEGRHRSVPADNDA
ncbi:hypothetical protein AAVH_30391, partial [Aphelenchoides avenae]